jgi:hypothetical protein
MSRDDLMEFLLLNYGDIDYSDAVRLIEEEKVLLRDRGCHVSGIRKLPFTKFQFGGYKHKIQARLGLRR